MKKQLVLTILTIGFCYASFAQPNMTLYQMHDITQSNTLNPAVPISCGWVVGFPGLGSISLGASSSVSYNDFGAGEDVMNTSKVISELRNKNVFTTSANINLLTIGYRAERTYYQFTINERASLISSVSRDPIELLLRGNGDYVGKIVKAEPSISALHYREYAFNVAREVNSTLWVGARAKLLFGRVGVRTVNNKVQLETQPGTYDLSLTTDVLVRASIPGKVIINPVSGKVSDFETDFKANDFAFNSSNIGAGLDLGAVKDFDNGLQVSASILNLGFINWSKNTHNFTQNGTMTFRGPFSATNELDALVDTVKSFLHFDYKPDTYMQTLVPMLMVGANYPVNDFLRVGLTGAAEFQANAMPWALTATGFTKGLPVVDLGLSYTVHRNSFFNVGFGIGAHFGPVDIHFLADNVIGLMKPFDAQYATLQFGLSFRFGCGEGGGSDNRFNSEGAIPCPALRGNNIRRK